METDTRNKVDQLFQSIGKYRKSLEFRELINFCLRFDYLSAYNAMLVQMQRPGATFVLTAENWMKKYNRLVKSDANPLVILVPFGPVDYVFDIADLEEDSEHPIAESVLAPVKTKGTISTELYNSFRRNLMFYGITLQYVPFSNQRHGQIKRLDRETYSEMLYKNKKGQYKINLPEYYLISIIERSKVEEEIAALVHELAHFFCRHLPPVRNDWWNQRHLNITEEEFEAETVAWLVCERFGIVNPSEKYIAEYLAKNDQVPNISIECILKATNAIEALFEYQRIEDGLLAKKDEGVIKRLHKIKNAK